MWFKKYGQKAINPDKPKINQEAKKLRRKNIGNIKIIRKSLSKYKLLLVIVGAYHLRKNSPLRKIKDSLVILPKYNGKEIFSPEGIDSKKKAHY